MKNIDFLVFIVKQEASSQADTVCRFLVNFSSPSTKGGEREMHKHSINTFNVIRSL